MRVVVFGAGYVGGAFARACRERGYAVECLTRNAETAAGLEAEGIRCIQARLDSDAWPAQIEPSADWVLNAVSSAGGGLEGYRRSYLEGARAIAEWASRGEIGALVQLSSSSVYSDHDGGWVSESDATAWNPAAEILLESEAIALATQAERVRVLRLSGIYGPHRHLYLDKLREGQRVFPGDGSAYLNLIHRDDAVAAIFAAFENSAPLESPIFNICDGSPTPKQNIVAWLARQLDLPEARFDPTSQPQRQRPGSQSKPPNRRVSAQRANEILKWQPQYPDYQAGFKPLLTRDTSDVMSDRFAE